LLNPDPVNVTEVPPFTHVPGVAVRVGGAPVELVALALHGTVVVVVDDVVDVAPDVVVVVVVAPPLVVVVVVPPPLVVVVVVPPPENAIAC
jgi:hypothetical protein